MSISGFIILAFVITLPIVWFISEFKCKRTFRCIWGILAILCSFGVAFLGSQLCRLQYNATYGAITKKMLESSIQEIEKGNTEKVLSTWKKMNKNFRPTYEGNGNYDNLVNGAVKEMKKNK